MAENRLTLRFTAQNDATKVFKEMNQSLAGLQSAVGKFGAIGAGLAIGSVFKDAAGALIGFASNMQQAQVSFRVMTGSADVARQHIQDLKTFALQTPFQLGDLVEQSKRLQAYGIDAQNVVPTLTTLGNIAAGVGTEKLPQITMAFGQVMAAGKLFGTELRQFTEAGVPMLDALAEHFQVPVSAIRGMVEDGKVGFADVEKALQNLTGEGGRFGNLMVEQSKTFAGAMSNIEDGLLQLGESATRDIFADVTSGFNAFAAVLNSPEAAHSANVLREALNTLGELGGAAIGFLGDAVGTALKAIIGLFGWTGDSVGTFAGEWAAKLQGIHKTAIILIALVKLGFHNLRYGVAQLVLEMARAVGDHFDAIKVMAAHLADTLSTLVRKAADLPIVGGFATGAADKLKEFADGLRETGDGTADLTEKIARLKDEALAGAVKIIGETTDKLDDLAKKQADAGTAAGVATGKVRGLGGAVETAGKQAKEAKKSFEELLSQMFAMDAALPGIKALVAGGDLIAAGKALMALGESAESAAAKIVSMLKEIAAEAKAVAEEAAREAKRVADEIAADAQKAADAWKARSAEMAASIIEALKAGKDWAVGTAKFFENEWLAGMEAKIAEVAQQIRNAMRDGLDITAIVANAQPLFDAYKNAVAAIKKQTDDAKRATDELAEAQRHAIQQSQEWIRQLTVQGDAAFQRQMEARKAEFDKARAEVAAEIAKMKLFEEHQAARAAYRARQKLQLDARNTADKRIGDLSNLLGGVDAPAWWVNGLRDALHGMVVKSYLDGKDVSKGVSGRQQEGSQLLASMGGFA